MKTIINIAAVVALSTCTMHPAHSYSDSATLDAYIEENGGRGVSSHDFDRATPAWQRMQETPSDYQRRGKRFCKAYNDIDDTLSRRDCENLWDSLE